MYIFVTGASGFIGPALITAFGAVGHGGLAISRTGASVFMTGWSAQRRAEALASPARDFRGDQETALVHLEVKQHTVHPSAADVVEFRSVNVDGTQQWLDWCVASNVKKFVYFSSIKAVRPVAAGITTEFAEGPPESQYGASKWAAEQRVRAWVNADASRSAIILRPCVVYGAGNVGNVGAMVVAIQQHRFFLVGKNDNVKSLVSVKNVAAAVTHLITRMEPGRCEIYNVVDRESHSVRQIDRLIRARLGKSGNSPMLPLPMARGAAKFGDAFHRLSGRQFPINTQRLGALLETTHFSCQKLLDTGFVHSQPTEKGIAEMVDWYAGHG